MKYHTCSDCASGLVNDDWTHVDEDPDSHEYASLCAFVEAMGPVTHVGRKDVGCFTCYVCDEIHYEDAHVFEGSDTY